MFRKNKKLVKIILFIIFGFFLLYIVIKNRKLNIEYEIRKLNEIIFIAEQENEQRLTNIKETCRLYKLGNYKDESDSNYPILYKEPLPHYEVFYYDTNNKLSWCPIYKAGSTTWLYHFVTLGGRTENDVKISNSQISYFVRNLFPPLEAVQSKKFLPISLKFIVVRHPFERILSAYRDKLEVMETGANDGTPFYYKKYGRKIVSKYRAGGNKTTTISLLKRGQFSWATGEGGRVSAPIGVEPTFKEFVTYLINEDLTRADDHWIPFYLFCTPCSISFDIVAKVETMYSDQLLIIRRAGVEGKLKPIWRHKKNPNSETSLNGMSEISKIYFSQLNSTDVRQLYEKYKLDFELFQYRPDEYFNYIASLPTIR